MFRQAHPEEIPALARMMCGAHPWTYFRYTEDECARRLANPNCLMYVTERDGAVIAFAQITPRGSFGGAWIELLCVDETRRGTGVGTAFVRYVADILYPNDNIYLTVSQCNPRAKALYERLGFTHVGEIVDYNFTGVSEYLMRLSRGSRREHLRADEPA